MPNIQHPISNIQKSFTLIEVLIIIGIIIILISLSLIGLENFQKKSKLDISAEEIISVLRLAQSKTLASEEESQYGIYFEKTVSPHRYILFKGSNYALRDISSDQIYKLPEAIEIYEINLQGGNEIIFNRIDGQVLQPGNVNIRLTSEPTKAKSIYIESSGLVGVSRPSLFTDERLKDSRHVHFDYNWSVQDAVTLHLIFPDYPGDNYDISFQDYLNLDKTEFDWEGTILVGPEGSKTEQILRIHAYSLTSFVAQFCVHRDRRYNDKAFNITLDTENLINYTGAGEESRGSSFWVEEPQRQ